MLPKAYVIHQTPFRLRLKIPSRKGDRMYFASIQEALSRYPGVEKVSVNATTAGVLLLHGPDRKAIQEHAEKEGFFKLHLGAPAVRPLSARALEPFVCLDGQLKKLTRGELDIAGIAFVGLVGLGLYQISIGNFTAPAWYTAFWYATDTALKARARSLGEADSDEIISRR